MAVGSFARSKNLYQNFILIILITVLSTLAIILFNSGDESLSSTGYSLVPNFPSVETEKEQNSLVQPINVGSTQDASGLVLEFEGQSIVVSGVLSNRIDVEKLLVAISEVYSNPNIVRLDINPRSGSNLWQSKLDSIIKDSVGMLEGKITIDKNSNIEVEGIASSRGARQSILNSLTLGDESLPLKESLEITEKKSSTLSIVFNNQRLSVSGSLPNESLKSGIEKTVYQYFDASDVDFAINIDRSVYFQKQIISLDKYLATLVTLDQYELKYEDDGLSVFFPNSTIESLKNQDGSESILKGLANRFNSSTYPITIYSDNEEISTILLDHLVTKEEVNSERVRISNDGAKLPIKDSVSIFISPDL